jgi:hypothetical protein
MSVHIYRLRHRESILMQDLHKRKLFHGCQSRQIQPRRRTPSPQVISLVLDVPERGPPQSMHLQDQLTTVFICDQVNIGFFPDANLMTDRINCASFTKGPKSQVIITSIRQSIAIICHLMRLASFLLTRKWHLAFCTRATKLFLAKSAKMRCTPPCLNLAICSMSLVGTISWFLEPISVYLSWVPVRELVWKKRPPSRPDNGPETSNESVWDPVSSSKVNSQYSRIIFSQ